MTFEYAREWLARADTFSIDPTNLPLGSGPIHSASLFGAMQDCGPDRWGRILIERAVRKQVPDRKPYREIDYVIALDDTARMGALRFRTEPTGPFLAATAGKLPPMVSLAALLRAADAIQGETETAADLRVLLGAGSPFGGACPKPAVTLNDGRLAIAKFPKPDDVRDIAAGEVLALHLAKQADINVAESHLITAGGRSVSVITRFDRVGAQRLPFLSANSLLGLPHGEPGAYTLIADGIRQFGDDAVGDLDNSFFGQAVGQDSLRFSRRRSRGRSDAYLCEAGPADDRRSLAYTGGEARRALRHVGCRYSGGALNSLGRIKKQRHTPSARSPANHPTARCDSARRLCQQSRYARLRFVVCVHAEFASFLRARPLG